MPIGTSKVGLFGGKPTVLAGCETFNAPGTFTVPEGLELVSATGVGGAGNPGNPGNSGGDGAGGNGGLGGGQPCCVPPGFFPQENQGSWFPGSYGGAGFAAGSPGTAGNPGNSGCAATALCLTFCGGAGGTGGAAGNPGTAGTPGAQGNTSVGPTSPGVTAPGGVRGSPCAGDGARGKGLICNIPPIAIVEFNGGGGGGGGGPGSAAEYCSINVCDYPGGLGPYGAPGGKGATIRIGGSICPSTNGFNGAAARGGGGGGGGGSGYCGGTGFAGGGGGGGGFAGAGNPGNAGNPGVSGTPTTVNCVAVVAGCYPVVVPSGGQINISWNTQ